MTNAMTRKILALACGSSLLVLSGCIYSAKKASYDAWESTKGTWNKAFGEKPKPLDPLKGSEAIDRDAYGKLGYGLAWSSFAAFDRDKKSPGHLTNAELLGDLLVVVDNTSATTALTTGSGQVKWAAVLADSATKFNKLSRVGHYLMATDAAQAMLVNIESGQIEGRQRFDRLASTAPIQLGDLLIMGSADYVYAHMMRTGHDAWTYRVPAPIKVNPVYVGGTDVAFVSLDGTVMIIDAANGQMKGTAHTWGDAAASPAVGDGAIYVASRDQSLYAFNASDCSRRWQVRTQVAFSRAPVYYNGLVAVHVDGTGLVGLNSQTGKQLWVNKDVSGTIIGARNGKLIAWDAASAQATTIDAKRGETIDKVTLPNVGTIVTSGFVDGDWYVVSNAGEVSKFSPR